MFEDVSHEVSAVEDGRVVVDVCREDAHLGVPDEGGLVGAHLIASQHVEVPNGAAVRGVTVQRLVDVDLRHKTRELDPDVVRCARRGGGRAGRHGPAAC